MSVKTIAIGASNGGLNALKTIFSSLPADFPIPISVVVHRQPSEQDYLCQALQKSTALEVREAYDKADATTQGITLAPAGYHLLVEDNHYALSIDAPLFNARPSISVLFESVADTFGPNAAGIILTGGGIDGVDGLSSIKNRGGITIVQDPATAACPELPQAAVTAGATENILELKEIGDKLVKLIL